MIGALVPVPVYEPRLGGAHCPKCKRPFRTEDAYFHHFREHHIRPFQIQGETKMTHTCRRRMAAADCERVGDFAWRFCCARNARGLAKAWRNPDVGETPTHLYLVTPRGRALMAIAPEKLENGHSWTWDGDLDKPTLSPSIDGGPDGWHGYLRAGVLSDA